MRRAWIALLIGHSRCTYHDYVEIGTADFDTLAQQVANTDATGLSVEPIAEHLERLPSSRYRRKVCAAVTEEDGWANLFTVRPEYMEPWCSNETLAGLALPYCLPWWFRATASLHRPSDLLEVHAGPMASKVQMVVRVRTLTYRSLLLGHNVTGVGLLKVDTEGFDASILQQMLDWGTASGQWPERVQFERNNLTDAGMAMPIFGALQAVYDCWIPPLDQDVHCMRLRNLVGGRPTAASSALPGGDSSLAIDGILGDSSCSEMLEQDRPWWRVELPERLAVVAVHVTASRSSCVDMAAGCVLRVGDRADPWQNPTCGALAMRDASKDGSTVGVMCRMEGRYFGVVASQGPLILCHVEALGVVAPLGSWRVSVGRQCCHGGCQRPAHIFDGYEPHCEARCRAEPRCRFFTIYSSLWCSTSESCEEDMPGEHSAATFAVREAPWLPLPLEDARQSSESWGGDAARAIDGRHEAHFQAGSCSHTAEEATMPWWVATLPVRTAVVAVRVLTRWECCHERLRNWEVRVGDNPDPWQNAACGQMQAMPAPAGARRLVVCGSPGPEPGGGLEGWYVGVVMRSAEPLTLCEVEAFASPPPRRR